MSKQVREKLAQYVLKSLIANNIPWRSTRGIPTNPYTKNTYSGINAIVLDAVANQKNYRSKFWATYQQWHMLRMQVDKRPKNVSEWGTTVVNWQPYLKTVDKGDILSIEKFNVLNSYPVFNAEQVFGPNIADYLITKLNEQIDYTKIENVIQATNAEIIHSEKCELPQYFRPPEDKIVLPLKERFLDDKQYTATKIHELFHWAEWRTGWTGSQDLGELIAEIGTGYLESEFSLPHDNDMANLDNWLPIWIKNIEDNPRYLFDAAAQAFKSIDYILGFSNGLL